MRTAVASTLARTRAGVLTGLLLATALAGCGGTFEVAKPEWKAGHQWLFESRRETASDVDGKVPPDLRKEMELGPPQYDNRSVRLEIFNASGRSVERLPIYVGAVQTSDLGSPPASPPLGNAVSLPGRWSIQVFNAATLNPVRPVYESWSTGEVQLVDDRTNGSRVAHEDEWFRFPLKKGQSWLAAQDLEDLNRGAGTAQTKVLKMERRRVPAGDFDAVRLRESTSPQSTREVESQLRAALEAKGYEVDSVRVTFTGYRLYWFAPDVRWLVEQVDQSGATIAVKGKDAEGASFDFTFYSRESTHEVLIKYELGIGPERPFTFAQEILTGTYVPRPITPTSHLAVEVLADQPRANDARNQETSFQVRVFNSTAGEKLLRPAESRYPVAGEPSQRYDHSALRVNWTFEASGPNGWTVRHAATGDDVRLSAGELGGAGLKRVSVALIDQATDGLVSDDEVFFDVDWSRAVSINATTDNVTYEGVNTHFPVAFGAQSVNASVRWSDATPHAGLSLRVYDDEGDRVDDEDDSAARFSSTKVATKARGTWEAWARELFPPTLPGTMYTISVTVRYGSAP